MSIPAPSCLPHLRTPATHQDGVPHHPSTRTRVSTSAPLPPSHTSNTPPKSWRLRCRGLLRRISLLGGRRRTPAAAAAALSLVLLGLLAAFYTLLHIGGIAQLIADVINAYPPAPAPTPYLEEDELAVPRPRLSPGGGFCGVCAEGQVLFHPRGGGGAVPSSAAPSPTLVQQLVCFSSTEQTRVSAHAAEPLTTAADCVAHLHHLGLLWSPHVNAVAVNDTCTNVRVTVQTLAPAAHGDSGGCSTVAQLRVSAAAPHMVEVHTPRLPAWPQRVAADRPMREKTTAPPYFATVATRDTDADRDVPPPLSVTATEDLHAIVLRFSADPPMPNSSSSARDLRCPTHFLTVRLGRFGRHHNQVQEVLNCVSLAMQANRTLLLPPFVPSLLIPYLKVSPELVYGWNTLRRDGCYCILSYAEARPVLQQLQRHDGVATVERVNFAASLDESVPFNTTDEHDVQVWGADMAPVPAEDGAVVYDADDWFSSGLPPPRTSDAAQVRGGGEPVWFREERPPGTEACRGWERVPVSEAPLTRWEALRRCKKSFLRSYGDGHRERQRQPRLVVVSSVTAFHLRPTLAEMTRLLGLLRPSPVITTEVGRYYRDYASQLGWPANRDPRRSFAAVLQPSNFRRTVGMHVRRRERTCRGEAENPSGTIIAMSKDRYLFDGTGDTDAVVAGSATTTTTTVNRLAADCEWDVRSLLNLYSTYATLVRHAASSVQTASPLADPPRVFVAFDEQVGPIGPQLHAALQQRLDPPRQLRAPNAYPLIFAGFYDRRSPKDLVYTFFSLWAENEKALDAADADGNAAGNSSTATATAAPWTRGRLLEMLYPIAEQEVLALAFDFFLLSNTAVFRGNVISSVSINVCVRRWGRGLPCHGVMVGYYEMLYKGYE
ncbi:phosphoglycan beta 1,2 arabinosyltransferase, (SCA like) [Novymonas esmeraldas]|uniref:Phosphoglycan beta 1,2 arabinosyltransferase, (SCA like) n=1 Tax=Novymonas esmeraldas TaxID=1808958 RepID=A0AAW0EV08_9TRYP